MAETVDQLPAVLTDAAGQLKAAYAQVKDQMDGGCEIYVSAETGGYNLQIAFSTGRAAGIAAAEMVDEMWKEYDRVLEAWGDEKTEEVDYLSWSFAQ